MGMLTEGFARASCEALREEKRKAFLRLCADLLELVDKDP
jgi:hypothetical protein